MQCHEMEVNCFFKVRSGITSVARLDTASLSAGTSDSYGDRPSGRSTAYTRRENRLAALSSRTEDDSSRDYKKVGHRIGQR